MPEFIFAMGSLHFYFLKIIMIKIGEITVLYMLLSKANSYKSCAIFDDLCMHERRSIDTLEAEEEYYGHENLKINFSELISTN